ncbi:hypothetical protein TNCV_4224031 [Trichonephila clavipes]|nr:hypothetical protein TNCV_4224031 [Trichonephila clavipes]
MASVSLRSKPPLKMCGMLWGRQVAGRNYPPTNKNTFIRALTEEWNKLTQQLLDNVVQGDSLTNIVCVVRQRPGHESSILLKTQIRRKFCTSQLTTTVRRFQSLLLWERLATESSGNLYLRSILILVEKKRKSEGCGMFTLSGDEGKIGSVPGS